MYSYSNIEMNLSRESVILFVILSSLGWIKSLVPLFGTEHTWIYELKSVETHSSNTDALEFFDVKVERIRRGVYAASASFAIKYDIVEGDSNEIEVNVYRSESGVRDYYQTPFKVWRQHIFQYFSTFYKQLAMDTLENCSNLPVFKGKFESSFEKKTYYMDKCEFDRDGFPQHLQTGFYKVNMSGYGDCDWYITFVVEVESVY